MKNIDIRELVTQRMTFQTGELIVVPQHQEWIIKGLLIAAPCDYPRSYPSDPAPTEKCHEFEMKYGDVVLILGDRACFRAPALSLIDAWFARHRFDETIGTPLISRLMDIAEIHHGSTLPPELIMKYARVLKEANKQYMEYIHQIAPSLDEALPFICRARTTIKPVLYSSTSINDKRDMMSGEQINQILDVELLVNVRRQVV